MSDTIDKVDFTEVPGSSERYELTVYALSTCAFCKRAMEFLTEHGVGYRYVFLDQLDFDLKRAVKQELKERYENLPVFPVLTIDGKEAISGFTEERWSERLGIDGESSGADG
ncbi:MAG: glutaredoxin family protein [Spirochaetota bacterium]